MKKKTLLIYLFTILLIVSPACGKPENAPTTVDEEKPVEDTSKEEKPEAIPSGCNNILYPFSPGNEWIYESQFQGEDGQTEISEFAWSVTEASDTTAKLGTLFYDTGVVLNSEIVCENGAILNFPMTQLNMVFGDVEGDINYDFISGLFMPSEAEFEAGSWANTWETNIVSSGTITASYDGDTITMVLADSPINMKWEIAGKDLSITVPAGTFTNVVLVKQNLVYEINSMQINIEGEVMDIATTIVMNNNMWFAPTIGLLKQEVDSATVEFFGINFPIEPIGKVELKSTNTVE